MAYQCSLLFIGHLNQIKSLLAPPVRMISTKICTSFRDEDVRFGSCRTPQCTSDLTFFVALHMMCRFPEKSESLPHKVVLKHSFCSGVLSNEHSLSKQSGIFGQLLRAHNCARHNVWVAHMNFTFEWQHPMNANKQRAFATGSLILNKQCQTQQLFFGLCGQVKFRCETVQRLLKLEMFLRSKEGGVLIKISAFRYLNRKWWKQLFFCISALLTKDGKLVYALNIHRWFL